MISIKNRARIGGAIWATLSVLVGGLGLLRYLEYEMQQGFEQALFNRHTQIVVAMANTHGSPGRLEQYINDPVYIRPFSGEYWQVINDKAGVITSRSLLDGLLRLPNEHQPGEISVWKFLGPDGAPLQGIAQSVELEDGSQWSVIVATTLEPLLASLADLRKRLITALSLIMIGGIIGAGLLTRAVLAPLRILREDVAARWNDEGGLDESRYPSEIVPLIRDINTLLERNRSIIGRSRRQAADLAHAIKTPSTIMRNELEQLPIQGGRAATALEALDRLDAQLKRSFARMRASDAKDVARATTDLDHSLGRMVRAFSALSQGHGKSLESALQPSLSLRMDANDFEEITGNLLDNALKWSASRILVSSREENGRVTVSVEDDGPGIPKEDRKDALLSGKRLDTSVPGTGLGLAIAADLAKAYGGEITLNGSHLGGLKVDLSLSNTSV